MIKFIHKKRIVEDGEKGKIIIYYNLTDIFLGLILFGLVVFFINDYLSHSLKGLQNNCMEFSKQTLDIKKNEMPN